MSKVIIGKMGGEDWVGTNDGGVGRLLFKLQESEEVFDNSERLRKENQRLTAIATKHATRADELYEALKSTNKELYFLINELNKYRTKDVRCDQLDPPELHDMETCHLNAILLDKSRIEAEKGDGICD